MVSLVMRGERTPTLQLAYKIAEALKCSTEELLKHLGLIVGRAHNWMGEVRTSTVKVSRRVTEKAA
jgi:transcriptional regulator with XRE-family HTH domain